MNGFPTVVHKPDSVLNSFFKHQNVQHISKLKKSDLPADLHELFRQAEGLHHLGIYYFPQEQSIMLALSSELSSEQFSKWASVHSSEFSPYSHLKILADSMVLGLNVHTLDSFEKNTGLLLALGKNSVGLGVRPSRSLVMRMKQNAEALSSMAVTSSKQLHEHQSFLFLHIRPYHK